MHIKVALTAGYIAIFSAATHDALAITTAKESPPIAFVERYRTGLIDSYTAGSSITISGVAYTLDGSLMTIRDETGKVVTDIPLRKGMRVRFLPKSTGRGQTIVELWVAK